MSWFPRPSAAVFQLLIKMLRFVMKFQLTLRFVTFSLIWNHIYALCFLLQRAEQCNLCHICPHAFVSEIHQWGQWFLTAFGLHTNNIQTEKYHIIQYMPYYCRLTQQNNVAASLSSYPRHAKTAWEGDVSTPRPWKTTDLSDRHWLASVLHPSM